MSNSHANVKRGAVQNVNRIDLLYGGSRPAPLKVSDLPEQLQVQEGAQQRTGDHTSDHALKQYVKGRWTVPVAVGGGSEIP